MSAPTYRVNTHWPKPPLSLNRRMHYMVEHRAKTQIREELTMLCKAQHAPRGLGRVHIAMHWVPATKRQRDSDNPTATLKPSIDTMVAYGLVPNDSAEYVSSECVIDPVLPEKPWTMPCRVYFVITDLTDVPREAA